jgi:hypothetical protein
MPRPNARFTAMALALMTAAPIPRHARAETGQRPRQGEGGTETEGET